MEFHRRNLGPACPWRPGLPAARPRWNRHLRARPVVPGGWRRGPGSTPCTPPWPCGPRSCESATGAASRRRDGAGRAHLAAGPRPSAATRPARLGELEPAAAAGGRRPGRRRRPVVAPGRGHRPRPGRALGRRGHRHRLGQVALLPAADRRGGGHAGPLRVGARWSFPTKALAHDQLRSLTERGFPGVVAAAYDGDTGTEERAWARRQANVVLTNPEMLHSGLLPAPRPLGQVPGAAALRRGRRDARLPGHLRVSHLAHVLRRLRRLAHRYGADPTFVFCSATIGEPSRLATALCGLPVDRGRSTTARRRASGWWRSGTRRRSTR